MMSLSNIYNNFAKDKNIKSLFDSHSIPIRDYNLINKKYIEILEEYLNTQNLTRDKLMTLTEIPIEEVSLLMAVANDTRENSKGNLISFSKNVFIPLTQLCRDQCSYCTFKIEPGEGPLLVTPEEVLKSTKKAVELGCTELLFVSGD